METRCIFTPRTRKDHSVARSSVQGPDYRCAESAAVFWLKMVIFLTLPVYSVFDNNSYWALWHIVICWDFQRSIVQARCQETIWACWTRTVLVSGARAPFRQPSGDHWKRLLAVWHCPQKMNYLVKFQIFHNGQLSSSHLLFALSSVRLLAWQYLSRARQYYGSWVDDNKSEMEKEGLEENHQLITLFPTFYSLDKQAGWYWFSLPLQLVSGNK